MLGKHQCNKRQIYERRAVTEHVGLGLNVPRGLLLIILFGRRPIFNVFRYSLENAKTA
jgi:hypothetical protein